jgi:hypothetical protein
LINDYNAKQQANTDTYNAYANHGTASGGSLSADYGKLDAFNAGTITVGPDPVTPPAAKTTTPGVGRHRAPDTTDTGTGHTTTPPGTATVPPGAATPGGGPGDHSGNGASGPGAGQSPPDGTTTAGFTPSTPTPGGSWPGGLDQLVPPIPGGGSSSGSTGSPSPYAVGGLGYLDGPGSGAGGKVQGGPGSGTGSGVPGSGRQTGARGGLVEEPGRTGPAGSSRAGGRVQNGPGGVGQAGRGAKEEDKEHQRKFMLDTELFSDEDRREVDPVTGLPPVPPTIGA